MKLVEHIHAKHVWVHAMHSLCAVLVQGMKMAKVMVAALYA
jgi:hypothetical protein